MLNAHLLTGHSPIRVKVFMKHLSASPILIGCASLGYNRQVQPLDGLTTSSRVPCRGKYSLMGTICSGNTDATSNAELGLFLKAYLLTLPHKEVPKQQKWTKIRN